MFCGPLAPRRSLAVRCRRAPTSSAASSSGERVETARCARPRHRSQQRTVPRGRTIRSRVTCPCKDESSETAAGVISFGVVDHRAEHTVAQLPERASSPSGGAGDPWASSRRAAAPTGRAPGAAAGGTTAQRSSG